MKKISVACLVLLITNTACAKPKFKCRNNATPVSCEGVEGAKRKGFCWKGDLAEDKKVRFCKKASRRSKKMSKNTAEKK